jgi:hypothetical protein
MKIGILTLPLTTNYGSVLQAYALQTALKRMGHNPWLIDIRGKKIPSLKLPLVIMKRAVLKYLLPHYASAHQEQGDIMVRHARSFIMQYMGPKTFPVYLTKGLKKLKRYNFDAYIVGSDQVWRPKYVNNIEDFFLGFLDTKDRAKRIAYAASFGKNEWEFTPQQTAACGDLLKKFQAVSVREESGAQLCKEHFGVDAVHLADPTILLDTADYMKLADGAKKSQGNLAAYLLDKTDEKMQLVDKIADKFGCIPFGTSTKTENGYVPLKVEDWVKGILDAKFVVTDSFHACIFSILFNKPFIAYGNESRGMARFDSLLKVFGLRDRLIISTTGFNDEVLDDPINWDRVNEILEEKRKISREFLENSLS